MFTEVGSKARDLPTLPVARITPGALSCVYTEPSRVFHEPRIQCVSPWRWSSHESGPSWQLILLPSAPSSGGVMPCHTPPAL